MLGWLRSRISLALRHGPAPDASRTAEACFHLGNLHCSHGRLGDAELAFRDALKLRPAYADALNNLGSLFKDAGRVAEAERTLSDAVRARPHFAEAHFNLGTLLVDLRRYSEAVEHLRSSLAVDPQQADAQYWLGNASMGLGDSRAARAAYEAAIHLDAGHAKAHWGLVMAQVPPVIDADSTRVSSGTDRSYSAPAAAFTRELGKASAWLDAQKPKDAHAMVGAQQPFYLAYVEGNHRQALSEYGQVCTTLMSQWAASVGLPVPSTSSGANCRVGIVSSHIHNHSVWNAIVRGWVEHLDPKRFALHLFHTGSVEDGETAWAERRVPTLHRGSRDWSQWAKVIADARLDVLLFPEVGMDATTVRLACLRLARVQLASWGHPITTGLPTLDGYLSAGALETAGAAADYTEALFLLPRLGCCYTMSLG